MLDVAQQVARKSVLLAWELDEIHFGEIVKGRPPARHISPDLIVILAPIELSVHVSSALEPILNGTGRKHRHGVLRLKQTIRKTAFIKHNKAAELEVGWAADTATDRSYSKWAIQGSNL